MNEQKARIYTVLIKVAIAIIATVFLFVFVIQYANMIKLQNEKDRLNTELANSTQYNNYLEEQIESIQDPNNEDMPNEEYVVDTAHENGYVQDGETIIIGD